MAHVAGVNFAQTLAFLITCPMGWFVWVGPKVTEYLERANRRLNR